jgi:hypothetical protein
MPGVRRVFGRDEIYAGKTYSSWLTDWFNWFLSADADERNFGPVVFLRASSTPSSFNGGKGSQLIGDSGVSNIYSDDPNYSRQYANEPNVRIGGDRLRIKENQAVLIPVIVSFEIARKPYYDWGSMSDFTGLTIDYGDNPPENQQLVIDDKPFNDLGEDLDLKNFRVVTPIFPAVVPETDYGRSVKDFLEEAFNPGVYPAIVEGYFVLLQFEGGATYFVRSYASAPREVRGPYFSELVYQIQVDGVGPDEIDVKGPTGSRGAILQRPSGNVAKIRRMIKEKMRSGEITRNIARDLLIKSEVASNATEANQLLD